MPKVKKFVDKKKSVTFQLVHRSQQDPLIADDEAPQRVLLPVSQPATSRSRNEDMEERHKHGIYFTDDSNYLQHIKDRHDHEVEWPEHVEDALKERRLRLPSTVFASEHEDKEGMLSRAAPVSGPQLHLDPDLVAAMDDDFDYSNTENELEDNFIELADGVASDQEFDAEFGSDFGSEDRDEVNSLPGSQHSFDDEETKSRFTNYSMSSSVMRRNEQLTLLDERFEKMFAEYDENEIGALDCEEIEGHVPTTADILLQYAEEFQEDKKTAQLEAQRDKEIWKTKVIEQLERDSDDEEFVYVEVKEKPKYDCVSILSTYSNKFNHPKIIEEPKKPPKIKVDSRTGMPLHVLGANKLTKRALDKLNDEYEESEHRGPESTDGKSVTSVLSTLSIRPKDETPEERRERKKMFKDYRRERRVEKKASKEAFKEENKRQVKISINNRKNMQGKRIL